jgi:hypothetical protein
MAWIKSACMAFNHGVRQLANGQDFEGFLIATRDIQPGEELLWKYDCSQAYRTFESALPNQGTNQNNNESSK